MSLAGLPAWTPFLLTSTCVHAWCSTGALEHPAAIFRVIRMILRMEGLYAGMLTAPVGGHMPAPVVLSTLQLTFLR